ncbi:MAG: O-methyltransferase [Lachnospiraceae bacterium]|nr:O-methyltransferase [Lachnospiraceae bacterium]
MIQDDRMISFINSLDSGHSPLLAAIEKEAVTGNVPVIRKEMQGLLKFMVAAFAPEKILEVGTATGFSALLMWEASGKKCKITTIEKYEKRIPVARENLKRAGAESCIELIEGDADEVLDNLKGTYPMIFMDAAKGQYLHFLPKVTRLLADGGILITDNVLQEGDICESRYAVTRRNRTIHSRMREYLYQLTHSDVYETVLLNIGDGVALSVKHQ